SSRGPLSGASDRSRTSPKRCSTWRERATSPAIPSFSTAADWRGSREVTPDARSEGLESSPPPTGKSLDRPRPGPYYFAPLHVDRLRTDRQRGRDPQGR